MADKARNEAKPLAPQSAARRRYAALRGARMACIALVLCACASAASGGAAAQTAGSCAPGAHNYGDGMVASRLTDVAIEAVTQARARALQQAGAHLSSFLADQPWTPHVSVIYGVTDDRITAASQALQAFVTGHRSASACFGEVRYWDDTAGGKTTLVVDVVEPAGLLRSLHDTLAQAAHIGSRFVYQPHVTLLYLQAQTRLSAAGEAMVRAPLRDVCWPNGTFYVTDRCGQERQRARMP